jgi:hypothetical protein
MIQEHDVLAGCCWLQLALLVAAGYSWFHMFSKLLSLSLSLSLFGGRHEHM